MWTLEESLCHLGIYTARYKVDIKGHSIEEFPWPETQHTHGKSGDPIPKMHGHDRRNSRVLWNHCRGSSLTHNVSWVPWSVGKDSNILDFDQIPCSCGSLHSSKCPAFSLFHFLCLLWGSCSYNLASSSLLCLSVGYERARSRQLLPLSPTPSSLCFAFLSHSSVLLNYNGLFIHLLF